MLRWKQGRTFLRMNSTSETKLVRYEKRKWEYTDNIPGLCILKDGTGGEMYFSCYSSERKSDWFQRYLTEA